MSGRLDIADTLRAWGLNVIETDGWRERGVGSLDAKGVVLHHTAAGGGRWRNTPSLKTVLEGRPDLRPPLCHVLMGRNGDCYVIASGVANHAGSGGWQPAGPGTPRISGNSTVLGLEVENDGIGEPYSDELYEAMTRASAALLWMIRRDSSWLCGHKEWTPRKIDPKLDMVKFRDDVHRLLERGPTVVPEPEKLILPANRRGVVADIQQMLAEAGFYSGALDDDPGPFEVSLTRHAMHALKNDRVAQIKLVEELRAKVEELTAVSGVNELRLVIDAIRPLVADIAEELGKVEP